MTRAKDLRRNLEASKVVKCVPFEKLRQNKLSRSGHNLIQVILWQHRGLIMCAAYMT